MNVNLWIQSIGLVILGAAGSVLFKIGVNQRPALNLSDPISIIKFVFSSYIFISLVLLMFARILMSLPLRSEDVGKYMFILTPLTLLATLSLSILVLREQVNLRQMAGIALTLAGVLLLGY